MARHRSSALSTRRLAIAAAWLALPCALSAQATYNVRNYGAQGDGIADDTRSVQAAIGAARQAGAGTVLFPVSTACYMVNGVTFYSNINYTGESQEVCIKAISSSEPFIVTPQGSPFSNSTISNLTFDGNATNFTERSCIDLRGPTNVVIDHVTTWRCGEDGVYVTGWGRPAHPINQGDGLLITHLTASYNGRNGLSVIVGKNITVRDSLFEHQHISPPFSGVDVEPNIAEQSIENITFENCTFRDNTYNGFTAWEFNADRPNLNLRLVNCSFERNGRDGAYIAARNHYIGGIYVSGRMTDNGSRDGYRGGLDIWNARNIVVTNLLVSGATQALFLWNTDNVTVANSSLAGSSYDLNTNRSTNVRVHASTLLNRQAHAGSFSAHAGSGPRIATPSVAPGAAGSPYSAPLTATGDPTITWNVVAGSLPDGMSLPASGVLAGTPARGGVFTFTARAANTITYDERTYTLTVSGPGAVRERRPPYRRTQVPPRGARSPGANVKPVRTSAAPRTTP